MKHKTDHHKQALRQGWIETYRQEQAIIRLAEAGQAVYLQHLVQEPLEEDLMQTHKYRIAMLIITQQGQA